MKAFAVLLFPAIIQNGALLWQIPHPNSTTFNNLNTGQKVTVTVSYENGQYSATVAGPHDQKCDLLQLDATGSRDAIQSNHSIRYAQKTESLLRPIRPRHLQTTRRAMHTRVVWSRTLMGSATIRYLISPLQVETPKKL
jgi:hypothetical protein